VTTLPAETRIRTCSFRSVRPDQRRARLTRPNRSAAAARPECRAWPGRSTTRSPQASGEAPRRKSGATSAGAYSAGPAAAAGQPDSPGAGDNKSPTSRQRLSARVTAGGSQHETSGWLGRENSPNPMSRCDSTTRWRYAAKAGSACASVSSAPISPLQRAAGCRSDAIPRSSAPTWRGSVRLLTRSLAIQFSLSRQLRVSLAFCQLQCREESRHPFTQQPAHVFTVIHGLPGAPVSGHLPSSPFSVSALPGQAAAGSAAAGGVMARPPGRSTPASSNSTMPLQSRLHPCSG